MQCMLSVTSVSFYFERKNETYGICMYKVQSYCIRIVLSNAVSYDRLFDFLLELARCFVLHAYTWHHSHFPIGYIYIHSSILLRRRIFFRYFSVSCCFSRWIFRLSLFLFSFVNYLPQRLQWPQLVGDTLTANFSVIDRLKWQMSMREGKTQQRAIRVGIAVKMQNWKRVTKCIRKLQMPKCKILYSNSACTYTASRRPLYCIHLFMDELNCVVHIVAKRCIATGTNFVHCVYHM